MLMDARRRLIAGDDEGRLGEHGEAARLGERVRPVGQGVVVEADEQVGAPLDRLPGASNGVVMAGFADQGFTFAPLLGRAAAQFLIGGKSDLNLHRFRLSRFKR